MPRADFESDKTVELAIPAPQPPARRGDAREQLPGLEPERTITDWGRSERIEGLADQLVYEFLYRYWFRVEVEGIDNVPAEGAALLVANHAGAIPPDGAMLAKAIKEEHPRGRQLHVAGSRSLAGVPGVGMVQTKLGRISAHPANIERLLVDEHQLVLAFPEGRQAAGKPLRERYRLRPFEDRTPIEIALRHGTPIVPVAIVGAEEALPVLMRLPLPRIPFMPPLPLPAKFRIRFLEAVPTDQLDDEARGDPRLARTLAEDIRALIQENVLELVAERRSVWLG